MVPKDLVGCLQRVSALLAPGPGAWKKARQATQAAQAAAVSTGFPRSKGFRSPAKRQPLGKGLAGMGGQTFRPDPPPGPNKECVEAWARPLKR
jgi:hypothetical protein